MEVLKSALIVSALFCLSGCCAADFVSNENGALVETYDVKSFAEQMYRFANHNKEEKKLTSLNMYKTYENLMDTNKLVEKWEDFFKKHGV